MILLDSSILIDALTGPRRSGLSLRKAIERGERIMVPTLVLYEWLRGPRLKEELLAQESLFPGKESIPFGPEESALAATLYRKVARPRGREIDLAIAASAIARAAYLWTLNTSDFRDIPELLLFSPSVPVA